MKLEEVLEKRTELQHIEAVYEELLAHLESFLPSDTGPSEEILVVDGCLEPNVTQEAVDIVQQKLTALKKEIANDLEQINSLEVKQSAKAKPKTKTTRAKKTS